MNAVFRQDFIIKYTLTQAHKMKITCDTCIITIINSKNSNSNSFYVLLNDCTIYWMQNLQQSVLSQNNEKKLCQSYIPQNAFLWKRLLLLSWTNCSEAFKSFPACSDTHTTHTEQLILNSYVCTENNQECPARLPRNKCQVNTVFYTCRV